MADLQESDQDCEPRGDDVNRALEALRARDLLIHERIAAEAEQRTLNALRLRCAELQARVTALEASSRLRDSIIAQQRARVVLAADAQKRAAEAELRAAESQRRADRAAQDVDVLRATISWRITRPVRVVRRAAGAAASRLRRRH